MRTTVLYTVQNNYIIFRASVESLLAHVPKNQYAKLLIVDDCSSDKVLLSFLDQLSADFEFVKIIHTGEPADLSYYNKAGEGGRRICDNNDTDDAIRGDRGKGDSKLLGSRTVSKGHGLSINIGLEHVETELVFIVDSDILFTRKSGNLIPEMEKCTDMDEAIMNVGALVDRIDGIKVFDKPFCLGAECGSKVAMRGAWPSFIGGLSKMSGWREHNLPLLQNGGWVHCEYSKAIFAHGFKTCNFNVFKDGHLIHLGFATVRQGRGQIRRAFYFSREAKKTWPKHNIGRGWWYGHHKIPYTTEQFLKILEDAYANLDFSARMNVVTFEGES